MYSLVQGLYDSYLAPSQLNLLIVGAPGVGKTALLERLKVTQIPKRPSNQRRGSTLVVSTVVALTPQLKDEFIKGGAIDEISSSAINVVGGGNVVHNHQELLLEMNIRGNQSQQQHYSSSSSKPTTISQQQQQQQQQNWVDNHNNNNGHHRRYVNRKKMISTVPASPVVITQTNRKNRIFNAICPAPERYKAAATAEDDDEDFVFDDNDDLNDLPPDDPDTITNSNIEEGFEDFNVPIGESTSSSSPPQAQTGSTTPVVAPRRVRCHSKEMLVDHLNLPTPGGGSSKSTTTNNNNNNNNHHEEDGYDQYVYNEGFRSGSMEEIPITPASATETPPPTPASSTADAFAAMDNMPTTRGAKGGVVPLPQLSTATTTTTTTTSSTTATLQQSSTEEYDMKPNVKMLPLTKIRPTIGTNLGKIDIFGAKCNIFDVGGKMRKLWERYYGDCDAVIFCWKLGDDDDSSADNGGDDDSDSDEEDDTAEQQSKQQEILNEVRSAISDDIPFLIFGHVFGHANTQLVDKQYSTNLVMPHYHNPLCGLQVGCAKSGAGIVSAMEWLIPLAKRQQKERLARKQQQMSGTDDDGKQV